MSRRAAFASFGSHYQIEILSWLKPSAADEELALRLYGWALGLSMTDSQDSVWH